MTGTSLILVDQKIDLANLYVYNYLYSASKKEKAKTDKLIQYLDSVLAFYSKHHEKLCEERQRLRLEIRLITKGTPVTEPMDDLAESESITQYNQMTESQRIAFTELLKKAYKAVAMLCHPDREGGSVQVFQELEAAYADRDLTRINSMWLSLTKGRNLYWQSSEEGVDWASTELNRPMVTQEKLKSTPLYDIVRQHACGKVFKANALMHAYLKEEILKLMMELEHLRNQNGNEIEIEEQEVGYYEKEQGI